MRGFTVSALAALVLAAAGCATTQVSWQEQLRSYPLVKLGDPKPAGEEYVVHIPKGQPFATKLYIEGGLLESDVVQDVYAVPRKDLYFYKDWMSFDMTNWKRTRAALALDWDVGVPSWKNPKPGHLKVILNERQ
jgi:hypothetical protein